MKTLALVLPFSWWIVALFLAPSVVVSVYLLYKDYDYRARARAAQRHEAWLKYYKGQAGQTVVEYAVMVSIILILVIGTVRLIGKNVDNSFSRVNSAMGGQ